MHTLVLLALTGLAAAGAILKLKDDLSSER